MYTSTVHGPGDGCARPVNSGTVMYSTADGFPLASFVVATSAVLFTYPSKTAKKTFAGGAWTSPFELNFKHRNAGEAVVSGVKVKVTGGVSVAGSARLDKAATPAARSATPDGNDCQFVNCFTAPACAGLSWNIEYDL